MEDHLNTAIKNLTKREKVALHKKLSNQKLKLRLFQCIETDNAINSKTLSELLNYGDDFTGLYTLKNRLFDDIIETKLEIKKSPLIVVKEKVQNLRNLLYDKDTSSLLRESRKLEKKAKEYELYVELKEIYFCLLLTNRHDIKKTNYNQKIIEIYEQKQSLSEKMEREFYIHLLDESQDLFYFYNTKTVKTLNNRLGELEEIYIQLNSTSANFLYNSAFLTVNLNSNKDIKDVRQTENKINELLNSYYNSFLLHKYPFCQIPIYCLYSKLYYLTENRKKFSEVQKFLKEHINEIRGFQMFDCSYFYFVFISILDLKDNKKYTAIPELISQHLSVEDFERKSDKMKSYYYYLISVQNYYANDKRKCFSYLMKAREYFHSLNSESIWIYVENILLSILVNITEKDFNYIYSELDLLKRLLKKYHLDDYYNESILYIQKNIKQLETNGEINKTISSFIYIKSNIKVLQLIEIEY